MAKKQSGKVDYTGLGTGFIKNRNNPTNETKIGQRVASFPISNKVYTDEWINDPANQKMIMNLAMTEGSIFSNLTSGKLFKSKFKSTIDWDKWNKEILGNKALMDEYHAIEQATKSDKTWMKNSNGSIFKGTPEQFIQQKSNNFKAAFPSLWEKTYRGTQEVHNINAIKREHPLFTGDNRLASTYSRGQVESYWHPDQLAAKQSSELASRIEKIRNDINLYTNTGNTKKLNKALSELEKENVQGMYELAHPASFNNNFHPQYKTIDAQGREWSDIAEGATDDLAKKLLNSADEFTRIKNVKDPVLGEVKIINTNTPVKSLRYNNGMFDMKNPSIYKAEGGAVMPQEKTIKVQDNRKTNIVTGLPLSSKARKHAEIPLETVESIIYNAKKHGVDPGTALAIGLQETNFRPDSMINPFMLGNYNPYGDIIDESMKFMSEKNKYAKKLGKTTEEDIIQAYNGYGTIKGAGKMYGIDTTKSPIDMNTNPLYGKTVKQLRDSVIMQNPEILKLINMGNKGSVPKLKCGGKKTRKMSEGGINKVPTMQSSQLATKFAQANNLPQKALAENGLAKSTLGGVSGSSGIGANGGAIMAGADLLSDTVTGALETRKNDYTDNRINPEESMRKNANLDVAGDITKTTLKGAAAGTAIMPGLGTIIGAGVGLVGSGLKNILGSKKRQAERAEATDEWSNNWLNSSVQGLSTKAYAQGGKITGAGGPKEDKITKKIEDGSFIVPTENGEKALELGRQYLGWEDGEHANRNYPGTEVKVSNGEVLFTPEEVSILSYNGIDVDSLAPNSNEKLEKGMATGGYKYNNSTGTYEWDETADGNDPGYGSDAKTEVSSTPAIQSAQVSSTPAKPVTAEEPESMFDKLANYLPEIAGALQIGAAIAGSRKAGAMPDVNVSQYLKELSTEQRKDAQYGLEPGAKSAMLSSIERDKRNANNAIVNRGGTAGEVMSNLQGTLSTGIDKSLQIELSDAAEKARKKSVYAGTVGQLAGQDFDSKKVALSNWMQWQDVNAGLLNAGISNIVGVRKLRAELDAMKKIGNNRVDVSSMIPK